MKIGITATRKGANELQLFWLESKLRQLYKPGGEFHHGDCIGGDAQGFEIAKAIGYKTVAHPPECDRYRAFTESDIILPPRPYMSRNYAIVITVDRLLVVPHDWEDKERRSGTWATKRMAQRHKKPYDVLIWKD